MNSDINMNENTQWKISLQKAVAESVIHNMNVSSELLNQVGYYYQCYAPCYVYKYFPDDTVRFESIKNNQMWYSAPIRFNDPFDSDFPIDVNKVFESILKQYPDSRGIKRGSRMWLELRGLMTKEMNNLRETMKNIRYTTGVTCFSESFDSLLMWAHYAHNHHGICVEYELHRFIDDLKLIPVPTIYTIDRPCLQSFDLSSPETEATRLFIHGLTTKSTEWSYEKEWRIIQDEGACGETWDSVNHGALLPSVKPKSIILGCEAQEAFVDEVKRYCQECRINLFRMEKDKTTYRLNKKPVIQFDDYLDDEDAMPLR